MLNKTIKLKNYMSIGKFKIILKTIFQINFKIYFLKLIVK